MAPVRRTRSFEGHEAEKAARSLHAPMASLEMSNQVGLDGFARQAHLHTSACYLCQGPVSHLLPDVPESSLQFCFKVRKTCRHFGT